MNVSTTYRPTAQASELPVWDWRRELTSLDAQLTEVERQTAWDWRRDLAELETRMDQLAQKHGLTGPTLRSGTI